MLPFDCPVQPTSLQVESLTIPRFGSLTVNEILLLQRVASDLQAAEAIDGELGLVMFNWHVKCVLATLLIVSRCRAGWTLEQTQQLQAESVEAVVNLLIEERDRPVKQPAKKGDDREVDWADLYCRLRLQFPHEERLNARNFGNCPIALIEKYLETARTVETERLSNEAQAVANVGAWVAASKGAKNPKPRWFNVFESVMFSQKSARDFPPELAESFMRLHKKGRIPFWVEEFVDLEVVRASAGTIEA